MNYLKTYFRIIKKARGENRSREEGYYEKHHIKPSSLYPQHSKSSWNLVLLTAREHFICHWLLTKIFDDDRKREKMVYAFNGMCRYDANQTNRIQNSKNFGKARRLFSENHPTKNPEVRDKISKSLKKHFAGLTIEERWRVNREVRICLCGCGETFEVRENSDRKYFKSSHVPQTEERNAKRSASLKKTLSTLSEEDMKSRMKKSIGNTDHIERGKRISVSKKGKKTNQQQIMGERYAKMDDTAFSQFLENRSNPVKTRMINLREKYRGSQMG